MRDILIGDPLTKLILLSYEEAAWKYEQYCSDDTVEEDAEPLESPDLSETQRNAVSEVIAKHLLHITDFPDHKLLPSITAKIVEIFPSETEVSVYLFCALSGFCLQQTLSVSDFIFCCAGNFLYCTKNFLTSGHAPQR